MAQDAVGAVAASGERECGTATSLAATAARLQQLLVQPVALAGEGAEVVAVSVGVHISGWLITERPVLLTSIRTYAIHPGDLNAAAGCAAVAALQLPRRRARW